MKKMFLFAAMAGVAFASCTNDVTSVDNSALESKAIAYQPVVRDTRADAYNGASFASMAYYADGSSYFTEVEEVSGTVGSEPWDSKTTYYWPAEKLIFVSVSPYTGVSYTLTNESVEFSEYAIPDDNTKTIDIMYADRVLDADYATYGTSYVPVAFNHALAQLNVTAKATPLTDADDATITYEVSLTSVSISGVNTKGSVELSSEGDATEYTVDNNVWEASNTTDVSVYSKTLALTESAQNLMTNYWVIPQAVVEQKMTVAFTVVTKQNSKVLSTKNYSTEIELKNQKMSYGTTNPNWEMNHKLTYNIEINPTTPQNPIKWQSPTVADWETASNTVTIDVNSLTSSL